MKAHEHRAIGDEATGGTLVDLAVGASEDRFLLRHGDVIALSEDFFLADPALARDPRESVAAVCQAAGRVSARDWVPSPL